jgi:SAM-dependent methyltransferase
MATRFFQSLAVRLSSRLRATSRMLTRLRRGSDARLAGQRAVRVGEITERQVPPELVERLRAFRTALAEVEAGVRSRTAETEAARTRVATELDAMVELLREFTASARVLEIGYADPLAFRDDEHIRAGIGAVLFRECFPVLMLSHTMGRLYARPRAVAEDFETVRAILAPEPFGDGALGPLIDAWFLARPICRTRRAARTAVAERLREHLAVRAGTPAKVCDLACGTAAALLTVMAERGAGAVHASCIDTDSAALRDVAAEAAARGLGDDVVLICADVLELGDTGSDVRVDPQDAILLVDVLEYLDDEDATALLDWTAQQLAPGGVALATTLAAGHPDAPLTTHLLEWQLMGRTQADLERLLATSRFAGRATTTPLEGGAGTLAVLSR